MEVKIADSWKEILQSEFDKDYFVKLTRFVKAEYASARCYPPGHEIFNAFSLCPLDKVKVVLLGQDPYHEPGQAHGLSFSVLPGKADPPPSLVNIYKELNDDLGCKIPNNGYLKKWADQGVLLLNATLTVSGGANMAGSHQGRGWETFTDAVVRKVAAEREHLVFMLWGSYAQRKGAFVDRARHLVLETAHPSPLSAHRGFFGCGHFLKADDYLRAHGVEPIKW